MAEVDFEARLERMFAEAPSPGDADAFASRVETRLDRGWAARRAMIWIAGLAGGVIGATQLVMSNLRPSLEQVNLSAPHEFASLREVGAAAEWLPSLAGGETLWMIAILAATAIGLGLTRVIEEI